jgi:predicted RND superfamily exporter protein
VLSRLRLPPKPPQVKDGLLNKFVLKASRQRILVPVIFAAVVAISGFYIPRLQVVSDQLMFFKEGSEIRQTFARVEKYFGGAMPLTGEIVAMQGQADLFDDKFAMNVLATERQLENVHGIKSAFSIFDLIKGINRMVTGDDAYPHNPAFVQMMLSQTSEDDLRTWVADDGFRMMVRTEGLSSGDIGNLENFVAAHQDIIRVITGMPVLFDEMNKLVVKSQVQSLALALVLIFIMLWVTLRRITAALAGLLSGIYYYRRQGMGRQESVTSALSAVSRPVLANAFGLAIGLSALFFSPLRIHIQAASVMWVAMVVSSMAALLLVPIFYARGRRED